MGGMAETFFKVAKMSMRRRSLVGCLERLFIKNGREAFSRFVSGSMGGELMENGINLGFEVRRHESAFKDFFLLGKVLGGLLFVHNKFFKNVVCNRRSRFDVSS